MERHLRQSLGEAGGKEHACFFCWVWHKGNMRIRFAFIDDVRKGLFVGDRVALTDDFNIATYPGLLNSKITFKKNPSLKAPEFMIRVDFFNILILKLINPAC